MGLKPFQPGQSGNPGGVPKAMIQYRNLLQQSITEKDYKKIIELLLKKALKGERWAIKEVLDRTLGKDFTINAGSETLELFQQIFQSKNGGEAQ